MDLKALVKETIMETVIKSEKQLPIGKVDWRVLVVDQLAMRMTSACCKMHEICYEGITLVEDINKERESLPFEAVYLIIPIQNSVQALINDFKAVGQNMYQAAHVYFTEACPDDLFNLLCKAKVAKFIKTLKEINMSFVAYERQVFSLDSPDTFRYYYNPEYAASRPEHMDRMAEQIATLCATLKEFPSIRYRANFEGSQDLAQLVHDKLNSYKADDPTIGEGKEKEKSQLIILDRGFDVTTPVLHELTFQAMVHDLLAIENDVFSYDGREIILDENDDLWVDLRHKHIDDVKRIVSQKVRKFADSNRLPEGEEHAIRDLSTKVKKMPQYQKALRSYSTHVKLVEDCLKNKDLVDSICRVEQDLATGSNIDGEPIKKPMDRILPLLLNQHMSNLDKTRIIILYIILKNGVSSEKLDKLMQRWQLSPEEKQAVVNLSHLGLNTISSGECKKRNNYHRREREDHYTSRWVPIVKDIMEDCIENKLDKRNFPYLFKRAASSGDNEDKDPSAKSARLKPKAQPSVAQESVAEQPVAQQPNIRNGPVPRLIVFFVGGVTYSEMRCAYEVQNAYKDWDVIVGSSHITTPEKFLADLKDLPPSSS